MSDSLSELTLEITPRQRLDVIDITERVEALHDDVLERYNKAVYCSYHTTAGYLEQSLCHRLGYDREAIASFVQSFQTLFPRSAEYQHDQLELRTELTEAQKETEPLNADSHLIFMGCGLENCVTYVNRPNSSVFFIDLDGVNGEIPRQRQTTVIGYNDERSVETIDFEVPVSSHAIDSINLRDPQVGLFPALKDRLFEMGIAKGRVDIGLAPSERNAGLTVNEYETLLMQHDLAEVLRNPVWFMAQKGRNMLRDPRAIPDKVKNYAKYDLVRFVNEVIDTLGMSESVVERIIDKFIAASASRRLRMKRGVSLLINNTDEQGRGSIIQGTYQSPILVQWRKSHSQTRTLRATITEFE